MEYKDKIEQALLEIDNTTSDSQQVVNNIQKLVADISTGGRHEDGEIKFSNHLLLSLKDSGRKYTRLKCDPKFGKVFCQNPLTKEIFELTKVNISIGGLGLVSKSVIGSKGDKLMFQFISNGRNILVEGIIRHIGNTKNKGEFYYGVEFLNLSKEDKRGILVRGKTSNRVDKDNVKTYPSRTSRMKLSYLGFPNSKVNCTNNINLLSTEDELIDISENGIGIKSFGFIHREIDSEVHLEFKFNGKIISAIGIIIHKSKRKTNDEIFFGIKFTTIKDKDKEFIGDIISANLLRTL